MIVPPALGHHARSERRRLVALPGGDPVIDVPVSPNPWGERSQLQNGGRTPEGTAAKGPPHGHPRRFFLAVLGPAACRPTNFQATLAAARASFMSLS